jgi:hypothetical protein
VPVVSQGETQLPSGETSAHPAAVLAQNLTLVGRLHVDLMRVSCAMCRPVD